MRKRRVLLREAAQADLAEAYDWYREINPALAERLLTDFRCVAEQAAAHPLSHPIFLGTCRKTRLRIFPYYVYYRIERNMLLIHAILHVRRRAELQRKRARSG